MININDYILEKLKINKDVKVNSIKAADLLEFFWNKVFDKVPEINSDNFDIYKKCINKFDYFIIYTTEGSKEIWEKEENLDFIKYVSLDKMNSMGMDIDKNYYFGCGVYFWKNNKEDKFAITINRNDFNKFNRSYDPILIIPDK